METIFNDQERRLRELNGVLDLALLLAVDVITEQARRLVPDSLGLSTTEWQRRLIAEAAGKLAVANQFAGRFSLFSDDELRVLDEQLFPVGGGDDSSERDALSGEVSFELVRRGRGRLQAPSGSGGTVVLDGEDAGEGGGGGGRGAPQ